MKPSKEHSVRLVLVIDGVGYLLQRLDPDPAVASAAWRLHKTGEKPAIYDVHVDLKGQVHCQCADAVYVREKTGGLCKHAKACLATGLIPKKGGSDGKEKTQASD